MSGGEKQVFISACAYCDQFKDCRPFGPQGSMICAGCARKHWPQVKQVMREFLRFRRSSLTRRVLEEIRSGALRPKGWGN